MKFLIFGGTGYIGANMADYIQKAGYQVVTVSRTEGRADLAIDVAEEEDFKKIDFQPDVVVNCASRIPEKGKTSKDTAFVRDLFITNAVGAVNIGNWSVKNQVKKIINCSSLSVVRRPWPIPLMENDLALPEGIHTAYGMSKLSQEQLLEECTRDSKTDVLQVRISGVYGNKMPGGGIIFNILDSLQKNEEVRLVDACKNTFDVIHVDDISRAILRLSKNEKNDRIINLASGKPVTIMELAKKLKELTGSASVITNSDSGNMPSKSEINVERLKSHIGEIYDEFIPLETGLKNLVLENLGASVRRTK